jgi:hypothetical protein
MLLKFEDGRSFAQGACPYLDHLTIESEHTPRIFVPVRIDNFQTMTAVDTGGDFLLCDPGIADILGLDPDGAVKFGPVVLRQKKFHGTLHRADVTLEAEQGKSLKLDATVLVPRLEPYDVWDLPSFMGLRGCLERIRFAVDPSTNTFYFGRTDEQG